MKFQLKRSPARGRGFHFGLWPLRPRTSPRRVHFSFGLSTESENSARFFWSKTSEIVWLLRHIERLRYIHNLDSTSRIIYWRLSTSNSDRHDRFRSELQTISFNHSLRRDPDRVSEETPITLKPLLPCDHDPGRGLANLASLWCAVTGLPASLNRWTQFTTTLHFD
jgi:hypothetical protein